ncbi:MAG: ABC transporter permease [Defluviitaleaceae bacterium]|nr:ABC transporter permease [Defluviitaleaceae bacterium]
MGIFKRAMINVIRQPVKSFSLLFLMILLGSFLLSGISMSQAMVATETRLLMQLPSVATLVYDGDLNFGWGQPTREEITSIGNLSYVSAYDFTMSTFFYSQELSWIDTMDPGFFTAWGVNNPNIADVEAGLISLVEGRVFTQEEIDTDALVMMIPRRIALMNDLSIGSTIEIANIAHDYRWQGDWSDRFNEDFVLSKRLLEFKIVGIFDPVEEDRIYPILFYMPFGVAESMLMFEKNAMIEADEETFRYLGQGGAFREEPFLDTLFVLHSPRDLEVFAYAASDLLPSDWIVGGIDEAVFSPIVNSMDVVVEIASAIQLTVIVASIFILTLVLLLFLRDRRYEMGIYSALGDKKIKIIFQILLEIGMITISGLVVAIFMGHLFSQVITNHLFEQQLIEQLATHHFTPGETPLELTLHIPTELTVEQSLALSDVSLNGIVISIFGLISLMSVLISTILPIWYALKLEPKSLLLQK